MTHYDRAYLRANAVAPGESPVKILTLTLKQGDSMDNLASTKERRIFGPAKVETAFYPDGGEEQIVEAAK